MNDELYDTPEKVAIAIATFRDGMESPFWKLMQKILDKNIEVAKMQLEEGIGEEETKAEIDRVWDRLRIYREIRNTPEDQIKRLTVEEDEEINPDPFATEVDNDNQSS